MAGSSASGSSQSQGNGGSGGRSGSTGSCHKPSLICADDITEHCSLIGSRHYSLNGRNVADPLTTVSAVPQLLSSQHASSLASHGQSHAYRLSKGKRSLIAVNGTPSHSYRVPLAIWEHAVFHTVFPALTPARQASTQFTYSGGIGG